MRKRERGGEGSPLISDDRALRWGPGDHGDATPRHATPLVAAAAGAVKGDSNPQEPLALSLYEVKQRHLGRQPYRSSSP